MNSNRILQVSLPGAVAELHQIEPNSTQSGASPELSRVLEPSAMLQFRTYYEMFPACLASDVILTL